MVYKLIVTERAEEQLDECLYYLVYRLGNNIAAEHLLACIEKAYDRLEENPYQFPECRDAYLKSLKYREVILTDMSYLMIVKVVDLEVYIMGIFHQLNCHKENMFREKN